MPAFDQLKNQLLGNSKKSAPSISKEVTYSTENWTEKFSENSLRSIAKKILSVKINAVQFSILIHLDVYFELLYLGISYLLNMYKALLRSWSFFFYSIWPKIYILLTLKNYSIF